MKLFKARASSVNQIMGAMSAGSVTAKQNDAIKAHQQKLLDGKKVTAKQWEDIDRLIAKRDAPPVLPKTAKTLCDTWIKEQLFERRKELKNKYCDKGNETEDDSIIMAERILDWPPLQMKNEDYFEDDYFTGTPDLIVDFGESKRLVDMKNSWSQDTFPIFADEIDNRDYFGQLQVYMQLTGISSAELVYTLMSSPQWMIDREAKSLQYQKNISSEQAQGEAFRAMNFDGIAEELRVVSLPCYFEQGYIDEARNRVRMCREYITERLEQLKRKKMLPADFCTKQELIKEQVEF